MNFKNNVSERNLIYKYTRFNTKTIKFRGINKCQIWNLIFPAIYVPPRPGSLVRESPLGGAPSPCGLTYLSKPARGDIGGDSIPGITIISINYYDLKMLFFSRQDRILYILDTTILILYQKLYICV